MHLTLQQAVNRENNNFDLIRLSAAILVIFGHSFYLFPANGYKEPLTAILRNDYSGSLAVYIFFFLSGVFIVASFVNSKTFCRFILMRVFRIYPALIICNLLTVFLVGALFTTLGIKNYFSSTETWTYIYHNNIMFNYIAPLPGVFKSNVYKDVVNGSLWTLPAEIRCYLLIIFLGVFGCFKKNIIIIRVSIFFLAFIFLINNGRIITYFQGLQADALFFFIGVLAYTLRHYIIISKKIALVFITASVVSYFIGYKLFINIFYLTLIYVVLVTATSDIVKKIKLPGDYSYGIYIYGFLVQQILAHLFPKLTSYPSMLISMPIVVILGIISWHYIELPALKLAKTLSLKYQERSKLYQKDLLLKNIVSN